jgi:hypothetical protein
MKFDVAAVRKCLKSSDDPEEMLARLPEDWLDAAQAEKLQTAEPKQNITPAQAADFVRKVIDGFDHLRPKLEESARRGGEELLDAHRRVREAARMRGVRYEIRPELPPDVLGIYVYLPARG